jgi:hypothetical protein
VSASVHCGPTGANPFNQRQDVIDQVLKRAGRLHLTLRWVSAAARYSGSQERASRYGITARHLYDVKPTMDPPSQHSSIGLRLACKV